MSKLEAYRKQQAEWEKDQRNPRRDGMTHGARLMKKKADYYSIRFSTGTKEAFEHAS